MNVTKKEKRFSIWLKDKNFQKKYLHNIVADVCHVESTHALQSNCRFCGAGLTTKERNDLRKHSRKAYGVRLANLYNKRHKRKRDENDKKFGWPGHTVYFLSDICLECLGELENRLGIEFKKSFAP